MNKMWILIKDGYFESVSYIFVCYINEEVYLLFRIVWVVDFNRREFWNNMLGICISLLVVLEFIDNYSFIFNIESDRSFFVKGFVKEMLNFVILLGNIDLNCKNGLLRLDLINI